MLLLAGIVSAFIGISLANYTRDLISGYVYVGSYLALACLTIMPAIFLSFYKNLKEKSNEVDTNLKLRSYKEFLSDPRFLQAMFAATFGYVVMAFLMTATPISMHFIHNISVDKVGIVIQFHVLGMFLPSLITGNLVNKFGYSKIMYGGVFFYILTIILSLFEPTFLNYFISLIFLGIGWNFLYISGTSLLVTTYSPQEKFKAQGFNDLVVFSATAIGSLSAGILISMTSWKILNFMCIPFLVLILFSIIRADKKKPQ